MSQIELLLLQQTPVILLLAYKFGGCKSPWNAGHDESDFPESGSVWSPEAMLTFMYNRCQRVSEAPTDSDTEDT